MENKEATVKPSGKEKKDTKQSGIIWIKRLRKPRKLG